MNRMRSPLPELDDVGKVARGLVAAQPGMGASDLELALATSFGLDPKQGSVTNLFDQVIEELVEDGTWAMLHPDRLVDVCSLSERIVLTHRVNEGEHGIGALTGSLDLAGFSHVVEGLRTSDGVELVPVSAAPGHRAWEVPEGWFDDHPVGTLLAVRVKAAEVTIEVIDDADVVDDSGLVAALRAAYDHEVQEVGLPIDVADLVWSLLVDNPDRFAVPRPPLGDLCREAGLEVGAGQVAHHPGLWDNQLQLERIHATFDYLDTPERRFAALAAIDLFEGRADRADPSVVVEALTGLDDLEVLTAVAGILFDDDEFGADAWEVGAVLTELLAGRLRSPQRARLLWFAALAAERRHEVTDALAHLEAAAAADPAFAPALDRLAWYRSDQGDALGAQRLWRRLQTEFVADDEDAEGDLDLDLAIVSRYVAGAGAGREKTGRNAPCWCGSGRKFKSCHLGRSEQASLSDRVPWLCRKAASYLERRGGDVRDDIRLLAEERAQTAGGGERALQRALADPLLFDVALHELGWFEHFLAERGPLLPDDEALLARSWTLVHRTVYEVVSTTPGTGLNVRDLRTGDMLDVRERAFSAQARPHQMVCGRAVPDGVSSQFIGGLFSVVPGTERDLLEILDEGDGFELMAFVGSLERPPRLSTREGEPLKRCRATLDVRDPDAARRVLDDEYEPDEVHDDRWADILELDDESFERIIRAQLRLEGQTLVVETMSEVRHERVLGVLLELLPSAQVVSDERRIVEPSEWNEAVEDLHADPTPSPELVQAMEAIRDRFEERWCDDSVPALGGLTPRQAVADVTRREEVVRLLASFPEPPPGPPTPADGGLMRPSRLRSLLSLED